MSLQVAVVGGGSFGQGLAKAAARAGSDVVLWTRREREAPAQGVRVTNEISDLAATEVVFVAVPSPHMRSVARQMGSHLDGSHLLVHVSRGLVGEDLHTLSQLIREETPCHRVGALAGPLVAEALADGTPGGGIVGSRFGEVPDAVRDAIGGPMLRIYETDDLIGVEVASAMVGLMALGAGFARAMHLGPAALAVLVTRGMAEAARVGATRGAQEHTFAGLAGFGDLIAAMAGDDRPEVRLGMALASGLSLHEAGREAATHIEGIAIARQVAGYARRVGLAAPVTETIASVLFEGMSPRDAISSLMAREVGKE